MKKLIFFAVALLIALPIFAQNTDKESEQTALYENAKEAIESKDWVIIPTEVTDANGRVSNNDDAGVFIVYENGKDMYLQGYGICGNTYTNVVEVKNYKSKINKKGDITLTFNVLGRKVSGSYTIRIKNNSNIANVIYTPAGNKGTVAGFSSKEQDIAAGAREDAGDKEIKRFSGPIVRSNQAKYIKKTNAI